MKHVKPLYESTKAEYNTKIRDLKDKIKDMDQSDIKSVQTSYNYN